ncbi:MAG: substrate-binding domain-containing protein, partial [Mycetocola sp.]
PHVDGGHSAADTVIASGASAVITYNDLVAIGLLARLRIRGVSVPDQLSVIGWDDTFIAALAAPALTSIHVSPRELGARAVELLDEALGGAEPRAVISDITLSVRESSAPYTGGPQ